MTPNELRECFSKYHDDHFLESKLPGRLDLHAYNLLDSLVSGSNSMVSAAQHDIIYLSIDIDELAKVITEEQVKTLVECGIMFDNEYDCLSKFV